MLHIRPPSSHQCCLGICPAVESRLASRCTRNGYEVSRGRSWSLSSGRRLLEIAWKPCAP